MAPLPRFFPSFHLIMKKCVGACFLSMVTSERTFGVQKSSFWNLLSPLCCGECRGRELESECWEQRAVASEMLNPGNVDIAIKGTVWISQGVPCPTPIVTCSTERVAWWSRARSGLHQKGPQWEREVRSGEHGAFGALVPYRTP